MIQDGSDTVKKLKVPMLIHTEFDVLYRQKINDLQKKLDKQNEEMERLRNKNTALQMALKTCKIKIRAFQDL